MQSSNDVKRLKDELMECARTQMVVVQKEERDLKAKQDSAIELEKAKNALNRDPPRPTAPEG